MWGEILVPLDGSKLSENALPVAAAVSKATGDKIRLLHVWDDPELTDPDFFEAKRVFTEYGRQVAERHQLDLAGVEFYEGDPATCILGCAEDAGLVVIATHGRGGLKATLIGSVADKVIRRTDAPVIAVPGTAPVKEFGGGPVLVAVDHTSRAMGALDAGREIARRLGRDVVIVAAYQLPPPVSLETPPYPVDMLELLYEETNNFVEQLRRPFERAIVVQGAAVPVIVDAAEQEKAALVVVAASGKNLPRRLAFGSTTEGVLHTVNRPLLIVPASGVKQRAAAAATADDGT